MTGRVGLLLVVIPLGCFGSWIWWDQTRAWVPLDEPVSFDQGRSVTAEFEINVAGRYAIAMVTGHDYCFVNPCDVGVPDLHLSWVVSKGRGVVSKGTSLPDGGAGRYGWPRRVGTFEATGGQYVVHIQSSDDTSRIGASRPSLTVFEDGGEEPLSSWLGFWGFLACFIGVPVGVCMVIQSAILRRLERFDRILRASPLTGPTLPIPRVPLRTKAARPRPAPTTVAAWSWASHQSLILAIVLSLILLILLTITDRVVPRGFRAHLVGRGVAITRSPGIQPILVLVKSRAVVYVDSQRVSWEVFGSVLRGELSQRPPDWPVYLKGDPNMDFAVVGRAIDEIRGQGAEVIILTQRSWPKR
jgi:biopolymer transport protein ExbD